ncbi:hypothetical protein C8R45DRAFT_1077245 [Mycena sanguinolenta]|nr:hypothetical protein C8R45DRAFT_1077245 [Mycena sanguinolenta]
MPIHTYLRNTFTQLKARAQHPRLLKIQVVCKRQRSELLEEPDLLRLLMRDGAAYARDLLLEVVVPQLELEDLLVVFAQTRREDGEVGGSKVGGEVGGSGRHEREIKERERIEKDEWLTSRERLGERIAELRSDSAGDILPAQNTHPTHSTMSAFIRFGNHLIAPAGTTAIIPDPASPSPSPASTSASRPDVNEALGLALLLQAKIKDLERALAEHKARRHEMRIGVERLDKALVSLRAQDSRESDKLAKLVKRWNKTVLPAQRRDPAFPLLAQQLVRHALELPRDRDRDDRFVCPTTQATSAFNGNDERYRDSYTFTGSAWQIPQFSSPPQSPMLHHDKNGFHFATSPEALHVENPDTDTPTKHNEDTGHRAAFSDIGNAQDVEGNNGRKRKSVEFEVDEPQKKTKKAAEQYGSGRNGTRRSLRRKNSGKSKNY